MRSIRRFLSLALIGLVACDTPPISAPYDTAPERVPTRSLMKVAVANMAEASWSVTEIRRESGSPRTQVFTVTIAPASYRLIVVPLDGPFPTGTITVNGETVVGPSDFAAGRRTGLVVVRTLSASNTIEVRLTGAPGSGIALQLVDTRVGTTDTVRWNGYCARDAVSGVPLSCFDATLTTTWLAGERTRITLLLRNLQGSLPLPLPPSAITSVSILARTGAGPFPIGPLIVNTSGTTAITGSVAPLITTGTVSYPPFPGGPSFQGLTISDLAVAGCVVPDGLTPSGSWQTCGSAAGGVLLTIEVSGWWRASDLFIQVSMLARPVGQPQPSCATGPVPVNVCQPLS